MQAIHGFRMPLFFVVSGFFAAMLWRQRGMKEMLKHRAKRILLPLFTLGAVMIIATWIAMITGGLLANMGGRLTRETHLICGAQRNKGMWRVFIEH